jgi:hypothetical protein
MQRGVAMRPGLAGWHAVRREVRLATWVGKLEERVPPRTAATILMAHVSASALPLDGVSGHGGRHARRSLALQSTIPSV